MINDGRLPHKKFYGYTVENAVGVGDDATVEKGGFKLDASIAPGSYPNPENRMNFSTALARCTKGVRALQSKGKDAHGKVYIGVFGQGATDPIEALSGSLDEQKIIAAIDTPNETALDSAIRLANTSKSLTYGTGVAFENDGIPEPSVAA